jgi:GR25 family glycosyltransferase involved in LPS biosynthesis
MLVYVIITLCLLMLHPISCWKLDSLHLQVQVITMKSRGLENVRYLSEQFPKAEQFQAIDGRSVDITNHSIVSYFAHYNIVTKSRRNHWELTTYGALGAYLSHLNVAIDFARSKSSPNEEDVVLVLEDDVDISQNLANTLEKISMEMPSPTLWDIWLIGYGAIHESKPTTIPCIAQKNLINVLNFWGVQGYLLSKRGARKLASIGLPITFQIDGYYSNLASIGELDILARSDYIAGLDIHEGKRTGSSVQSYVACDVCDLSPHYSRIPDVLFWISLGSLLTLGYLSKYFEPPRLWISRFIYSISRKVPFTSPFFKHSSTLVV